MAVQDLNDYLVQEGGRISYDIYERTKYSSPWETLVKKLPFPEGMGETISNVMWERPHVATNNAWTPMTINDGTGNTCMPPVDTVTFKQTLRDYSLYHKSVESPPLCITDLKYAGKAEAQLNALQRGLATIVRIYWVDYKRLEFTRWANKYIAVSTLDHNDESDGLTFPPVAATSKLTAGLLSYFYGLLTLEQGKEHSLSIQNGRPVYGLITDQFTMRDLIRGNEDIRQDFRWSSEKDRLLQPLGVSHTYDGFVYMMDEMPRRFTFDATKVETPSDDTTTDPWTEVPPYVLDGDSKPVVNPAWLLAGYQDSYIYVENAFQLRVPFTSGSVGAAHGDANSYVGEFTWINERNMDKTSPVYNPDKKWGIFRGVMGAASEGINPHVMYVIRHKVCPAALGLDDCP